jgi:carboxyl-terminal processing protease
MREEVMLKNVPYQGKIQQDIGYIKLTGFSGHAADEVKAALESLKKGGAKKLILDLRGNPGGILGEAIAIVNLFIEKGQTVVETKGKNTAITKAYTTNAPAYDTEMPMVILIDEGCASASEIVSGVVQDCDRGVLIGKNTFGKGLVQTITSLGYNTQLKLTTAKYYIPSGRCIQKINYDRTPEPETAAATPTTDDEALTSKAAEEEVFKTQAGRIVQNGDGITPDIIVEQKTLAPITISLIAHDLIFDYATLFQTKHKHIAPAADFVVTEAQYRDFIAFLKDQEYTYGLALSLDWLMEQAEGAHYTEDIKQKITLLKEQIQCKKQEDLRKYAKEIKRRLQETIVGRYYFQAGSVAATLHHDQSVQKACRLLQNMDQYYALLKAPEEQKNSEAQSAIKE